MALDYEYGINTGNRFLNFVDHDEDPDDFIANQTEHTEKPKKPAKDTKTATKTKKPAAKPSTTTTTTAPPVATSAATATAAATTKTNKENLTGKSNTNEQRRQQTNVLGDNNQQTRGDSARGDSTRGDGARGGRGFGRRGGQDRPPYEGGRGGGQQRTQRYNKFEGQQTPNQTGWNEQGGDTWTNETSNENQQSGGYRGRGGRGRGRGNYEGGRGSYEGGRGNYEGGRGSYEGGRGNYEGGRGSYEGGRGSYEGGRGSYEGGRGSYEGGRGNYEGGRGSGRGRGYYEGGRGGGRGRGNFGNRSFEEGSQQQQTNEWQQNDSNTDDARVQSAPRVGQEFENETPIQERPFEPNNQRGGRGHYRSRTFHNNRNYGSNRSNQYEGEGGQDESRQIRRQHDRQPRSNVSGVKAVEKRGGEGPHNWGNPTENLEEALVADEQTEVTGEQIPPISKDWSQQVDEAEKQMTLDEYRKQIEAKKRANQEKLPQLNPRAANEGVDPKQFKDFVQTYRKKNDNENDDEEIDEENNEENEEVEENDDDQHASGKKKIISIPLHFKPIDIPRGGARRGTGRFRPNRDDQTRSKSPSQQTGEHQTNEQQSRPYRGIPRQGSGRGEYRRSYGNSNRGSRAGYNRSNPNSYTPDFGNTVDFPTLAK